MSAQFYTLLTEIGAAKLASAAALGVPLKITKMAVGDGGGVLPTPDAKQTALVNEKRRADLNMLYIDPQNSSQMIAEQVIPETEGGWWIREVGLFDETGALIAVGNCPESYKPQLVEGSGRTQTVRMVLITSSTDNITLKIDPSVVLATRKYVDDEVLELKVYVDDLMAKHLAAANPHNQYAPKESPTLTGTPKAPTAASGDNSTQIANTAFVQAVVTALNTALALKAPLASPTLTGTPKAPTAASGDNSTQIANTAFVQTVVTALNTALALKAPLASPTLTGTPKAPTAASGDNSTQIATTAFVQTVVTALNTALDGKQPLNSTLTALSGKSVAGILDYLGLGEGSALPVGVPIPYPQATPPDGWLKCNGAAFDKTKYPKLAIAYPSGSLPDLRGEFLRGWDDGRGIDSGRALLSSQTDAVQKMTGAIKGIVHFSNNQGSGVFDAADTGNSVSLTQQAQGNAVTDHNFDSSRVVRSATETRPRNVAFNYIVRAA